MFTRRGLPFMTSYRVLARPRCGIAIFYVNLLIKRINSQFKKPNLEQCSGGFSDLRHIGVIARIIRVNNNCIQSVITVSTRRTADKKS